MKKRTAVIAALVSLMPLGQTLMIGTSATLTSAAVMFSVPQKVRAESAIFYYKRGIKKYQEEDYSGCIAELTKAIEINSSFLNYYLYRANCKYFSRDFYGSISDLNKAINIGGKFLPEAYVARGISKKIIGDIKGACSDWRKASSLGDKDAAKWVRSGCN